MEDILTMESQTPEQYAAIICKQELGVSPISINPIGMSIGGSVLKVETEKGAFVVKLIANETPEAVQDEDVSDRVYGGRWTEFEPALTAMKNASLPLPTIHATGYTNDDSQYFILMDYVAGESVREYMSEVDTDDTLHHVIGETFGKLHGITRDYQGWVSMETSYDTPWGEAYFLAFHNQLDEIERHSYLPTHTVTNLRTFVATQKESWVEPTTFVLSHLDGFQGIASKQDAEWSVGGIIDIEDHQFTDQRFVLCGHELAMETEGKILPDSFWSGYRSTKEIDPTFNQHKSLFKLYYLSVWLCVFRDESIGNIPDRDEKAEKTIQMIQDLLEQRKPTVILRNEPRISEHEVDQPFNEMKTEFVSYIEQFVTEHDLFKDEDEVGIEFAHKGVGSIVAIIHCSEKKLILKIPRSKDFSAGEGQFLKVWEESGVSVPHVLGTGEIHGFDYTLMEYIDAPTLDVAYTQEERLAKELYVEMGKILRLMHSQKVEGYGFVVNGKPEFETVEDWLAGPDMTKRFNYIHEHNLLTELDGKLEKSLEIIKKNAQTNDSSYCHDDYGPSNMFATNPITIFDANPKFNSGYYDLGRIRLGQIAFKNDDRVAKQLLGGYFGDDVCDNELLNAYTFLAFCMKGPYWHQTGKVEQIETVKRYFYTMNNGTD
jgi:tRNA A-37 threonylcarbamoyl transferase component Bud32